MKLALFRFGLDRHEAVDTRDEARGEGSRAEPADGPDADVDAEDRVVDDLGCCAGQ